MKEKEANRKSFESARNPSPVHEKKNLEKLYWSAQEKLKKRKILIKENEERKLSLEMNECTFVPSIRKSHLSLQKFLEN